MKVSLSELRFIVRDILTEAVTIETLPQKYNWVGQDTAKMLHNVVWRLAADVVKAKSGNDSGSDKVKDVAEDIGMSVGAHMDDLLGHLAGQQKSVQKAPPPMRSQSQAGSQPLKRPTQ